MHWRGRCDKKRTAHPSFAKVKHARTRSVIHRRTKIIHRHFSSCLLARSIIALIEFNPFGVAVLAISYVKIINPPMHLWAKEQE